ncbi:PREDICTED: death-associated protein kinase 1-like [Amphimedon queenslandica]|uniref:Death domain-containing protein n=1 Tax=Amphimedon queenslandica TaxID=400682 RepID=A0A1X7VXZ0_AMPQE|nr:PREDICTED: death-associated protein kinase 1-like [Amphimedon queenslandica]|eukprot:XP_019852665.1 PREDICTED: death-associated protein kinase 1-like [Amphimedon queenslandica]
MAKKSDQNLTQNLLKIVDNGNLATLRNLLTNESVNVDATNKHGEGALHIAAGYGRLEIVKELRQFGARLDISDKQGDTPLYWASRHGHNDVVIYLCSNGVDINHQDKSGETATHVAARYGHPDVLESLISFNANLDIQDNDGDTPVLCACWHGFQNIVERLILAGSSLSLTNRDGDTVLHVSSVRGNYTIVRYLCEKGSDLNAVNKEGQTPLYLATKRNHLDIVQFFCEQGCNLNIQDKNGNTPLHEACKDGKLSLVHTLFAAHCKLNVCNKQGMTPLHLAALHNHIEIARHLCSAGSDLNIQDNEGLTVDQLAASTGNNSLAAMLKTLHQEGMRDKCLHEITLGMVQVNKVRLLVCGAADVGKTTLIGSLKARFLRSLRPTKFGGSYLGPAAYRHTFGFCVEQLNIPNAGEFSVWDFSGHKDYYLTHEYFLESRNTIYIVMYNRLHSYEQQLAQVRFWLAMIKSKHRPSKFIHYGGHAGQKPFVILVQSFADNPNQLPPILFGYNMEDHFDATTSHMRTSSNGVKDRIMSVQEPKRLLQQLVGEFGHHFMFTDKVFCLDCRQPRGREIQSLRSLLGTLRQSMLKEQPWVPQLVTTLQQTLPTWRKEYSQFPVMTWEAFLLCVQEQVNPLVTPETLQLVAKALNDTGEIIYITEGKLENLLVLNPDWLGQRIFGPALAPEDSLSPQFNSVTGLISLREIRRVYPELDPLSVAHLMEHFELCQPVGNREAYQFPLLIRMEPLYGLWEKDPQLTVYAGIRLETSSEANIFSPSVFPRAQLHIRNIFSDDIEDQEVIFWSDGLKCCRGEVEICVRQPEPNRSIEIAVRGTEDCRTECFALLQQFYEILSNIILDSNPGTSFTLKVLSTRSMAEHQKNPHMYSSMEIFNAERNTGVLNSPNAEIGSGESIVDLLCCGCKELEISVKSAPFTSIRDIPLKTRVELCRMLDPPDPFGRDWCLLALQLGVQEDVPVIDVSSDMGSPTDKLLLAWENRSHETVVMLVDALTGIGREDVAAELVNGLSPFSNPRNSLFVNIDGVVSTSYVV